MLKVALLDDYARVALDSADWGQLAGKAEIAVFDQHLTENEAAEALAEFDASAPSASAWRSRAA